MLGTAVGSFLNVCIHRLPLGLSLAWPGSHCPSCRAPVKPYDNIPIVSYLWLRGRCRSCKAPISIKYPIVELITGAMFLGAFLLFDSPVLIQRLLFACAMVVLFVVDLEHRILPDVITLPGIVIGFLFSFFMPPGWVDSLIGIIVGGGSLWLLGEIYFRVRHEEGMGFGDVKMLAMIGAFLGWKLMLLTLVLSSFIGSIVGVAMIVLHRGDMKYALPFGTFLALGAIAASTAGEPHHRLVRVLLRMNRLGQRHHRPDGHRRGADWRADVRHAAVFGGGPRRPHEPSREQDRNRVCHRRAARRADQAEGAGARDVGAGRSVRAAQRRDRRKPDVGPARRRQRRPPSHPQSGRTPPAEPRRDGDWAASIARCCPKSSRRSSRNA